VAVVAVMMFLVGILFLWLGILIWKKEMMTLLHDYHRDRISPEDKKTFCTLSGWGMILIGTGLILTGTVFLVSNSLWSFLAFGISAFFGIGLLWYAVAKYNR